MTPQFTTPCFVRVEDADKRKEVCEKLEDIGYTLFKVINKADEHFIVTDVQFEDQSPITPPDYFVWPYRLLTDIRHNHINCGTNIDLFLALAGMRSDTDKGQWFKKGSLMIKADQSGNISIPLVHYFKSIPVTRATAAEIIEHFKTK